MKITIISYAYSPSLGGIETVSRLVADGLTGRGHDVTVITKSIGQSDDDYRVIRRPSPISLIRVLRASDAIIQSNVSLSLAWPLLARIVRRPWVVVNHTPIARTDGRKTVRDRIKVASLPRNTYSVSRFLQQQSGLENTRIMPNPYDDRVFRFNGRQVRRDARHLLFVGRLAPVKGLDLLLEALSVLSQRDPRWRLTVVGDGPERESLRELAVRLEISERVEFAGRRHGTDLATTMATHRIVVMPSRAHPAEAFPVVSLESISSGCVVVASRVGGLPESVGDRGLIVPDDDVAALIDALEKLASDEALLAAMASTGNLTDAHTISSVAEAYERALLAEYR